MNVGRVARVNVIDFSLSQDDEEEGVVAAACPASESSSSQQQHQQRYNHKRLRDVVDNDTQYYDDVNAAFGISYDVNDMDAWSLIPTEDLWQDQQEGTEEKKKPPPVPVPPSGVAAYASSLRVAPPRRHASHHHHHHGAASANIPPPPPPPVSPSLPPTTRQSHSHGNRHHHYQATTSTTPPLLAAAAATITARVNVEEEEEEEEDATLLAAAAFILRKEEDWMMPPPQVVVQQEEQEEAAASSPPVVSPQATTGTTTSTCRRSRNNRHALLGATASLTQYAEGFDVALPSTLELWNQGIVANTSTPASSARLQDDAPYEHEILAAVSQQQQQRAPPQVNNNDNGNYQVQQLELLLQNHARQAPVPIGDKEKHLENLWHEFGELVKASKCCCSNGDADAVVVTALQAEQTRLVQTAAAGHAIRSTVDTARQMVEARQIKRRKKEVKRTKSGNLTAPQQQQPRYRTIQPWHIVLGGHSTDLRTVGTMALRYFCVDTKHNVGTGMETILQRTREWLQSAFPTAPEAGLVLYLDSPSSRAFFVKTPCVPYAFANNNQDEDSSSSSIKTSTTLFLPVAADQEPQVVKRVYTKLTPTQERSLPEIVQAYTTLLAEKPYCDAVQAPAMWDLLDYCAQATGLPLTQTTLNGLRESLDQHWAVLLRQENDHDE